MSEQHYHREDPLTSCGLMIIAALVLIGIIVLVAVVLLIRKSRKRCYRDGR